MLLITEYNTQDVAAEHVLNEATGKKELHISGIFMQAEQKNRNGRVYSKPILETAVREYDETYVKSGRAVGELDHPQSPTINLDRVSHVITELKWEGNNVIGKAKILETPMGQIARGIIEGGVQLGVSSRGTGSLSNVNGINMVNEDFRLNTVDIVADPSAQNAFVNGILEGVDWKYEDGVYKPVATKDEVIDQVIESFDNSDSQIKAFKNLLNSL